MLAATFVGCASNKTTLSGPSTTTQVSLDKKNFKILKSGIVGVSYGFRFLGIIPLAGANETQARKDLYSHIGPLEGKSVTLVNTTYSRSGIYLILFSIPKVTVEGDLVEFTDQSGSPTAKNP